MDVYNRYEDLRAAYQDLLNRYEAQTTELLRLHEAYARLLQERTMYQTSQGPVVVNPSTQGQTAPQPPESGSCADLVDFYTFR